MGIKGKTFLVTGGAGFIGSHTANKLVEMGGQVIVLDNLSNGDRSNLNPKIAFYKIDICDSKISRIFKKYRPDIVYHFAFNTDVPKSVEHPEIEVNSIKGSMNVLQNARFCHVEKFIFSSSGFIYGNKNKTPTKEIGRFEPLTPYAISKKAVEDFLIFCETTYKLSFVIFRYGTVYGPKQIRGALPDYINRLYLGEQAKMWGRGTKTRDYVYIDDVISANLLALKISPKYKDPIFNIGTGKETSLLKLYQMIANKLGKAAHPIFLPDRRGELLNNCLDASKFRAATSWEPRVDLKRGLDLTVNAFLKK